MKLFLSLFMPQLSGFIGSLFTIKAVPDLYSALNKPSFSPPDWLFGPVWLILYLMIGVSVYLIWRSESEEAKSNVRLFFSHLFINFLWTPVFFGMKNLMLAYFIIAILYGYIFVLIEKFWNINRLAALLLFPYFIWVTFAGLLNYYIWMLN